MVSIGAERELHIDWRLSFDDNSDITFDGEVTRGFFMSSAVLALADWEDVFKGLWRGDGGEERRERVFGWCEHKDEWWRYECWRVLPR